MTYSSRSRAIQGRLLTFTRAPVAADDVGCLRYYADGLIHVVDGRIAAIGTTADLLPHLPPDIPIDRHGDRLILPGFIDLHIHLPQTRVIASYGAQLMEWLERYTFAEEAKYADPAYAAAGAAFFLDELRRNGTTTAVVYGSVHASSVDALFSDAARRGAGMIAGKVMMDRNAPAALCDSAQSSYDDSKALIARWHGRERQRYAVTPRFAITSTAEQLDAAGALMREHDGLYMQTHLSENKGEIDTVMRLNPRARDYTDVYDRFGLMGPRALFGHCLHLSDAEMDVMADRGSVAVICPTSNLFLGSGMADPKRMANRPKPVRTGLATDVGAGTSYSMLRTAAEAYKVQQLQGHSLPALEAFWWITRANAEALSLQQEIGSIEIGCYADLVVLDSRATPSMAHRMEVCRSLEDELFVLLTLGDDRSVVATYLQGAL